jgi:transcriptional regulator with XRE-family HTH domain
MDTDWLAERIRCERTKRRISIRRLSREAGVNRNLTFAVERGMRPSSIEPLERLAHALGIETVAK